MTDIQQVYFVLYLVAVLACVSVAHLLGWLK